MPAPTAYTESSLIALMEDELGALVAQLGIDQGDALVRAAYAVQRRLGLASLAEATDLALAEAAARLEAWRAAESAAVGQYTLKAGTATLNRAEVFEHIQAKLATARTDWYAEEARAASDGGASPFYFATVPGCRGR